MNASSQQYQAQFSKSNFCRYSIFIVFGFLLLGCNARRLSLPDNLRFGQSTSSFIEHAKQHSDDDYANKTSNTYTDTLIKELWYRPVKSIGGPSSITGYFIKKKLAAVESRYYLNEKEKATTKTVYDSLVQTYGTPTDSAGLYGREWSYEWAIGKQRLVMEIERKYRIVVLYQKTIKPAIRMANLEKELHRLAPMNKYARLPLDKSKYDSTIKYYKPSGQDTATLTIPLVFSKSSGQMKFPIFNSIILSAIGPEGPVRRIAYTDSLLGHAVALHGMPIGVYRINLKSIHYEYSPSWFFQVACSACAIGENKVTAYIPRPDEEDYNKIGPSPYGYYPKETWQREYDFNLRLQKDFFKYLTDKEVKKIYNKEFVIKGFYTRGNYTPRLSDIAIYPNDLSPEERSILLKGFSGLGYWQCGARQYQVVVTNQDIFPDLNRY
jgi:hypothetical protein